MLPSARLRPGSRLRFVVDHCVPAEVARWLAAEGHQAWTADAAGLAGAQDDDLIVYAHAKDATLVTTNRDCAQLGRRLRSASIVWLAVVEIEALAAMQRAVGWLEIGLLPSGRVLRVSKTVEPKLLAPLPLR